MSKWEYGWCVYLCQFACAWAFAATNFCTQETSGELISAKRLNMPQEQNNHNCSRLPATPTHIFIQTYSHMVFCHICYSFNVKYSRYNDFNKTQEEILNSPFCVSCCGVSSSSCHVCPPARGCSPGLKAVGDGDCSCGAPGSVHWGTWRVFSCVKVLPGYLCIPGASVSCSSREETAQKKSKHSDNDVMWWWKGQLALRSQESCSINSQINVTKFLFLRTPAHWQWAAKKGQKKPKKVKALHSSIKVEWI